MLRTYHISNYCDLKLLLLVILVFQHLCYCQGQIIVDCRTLNGYYNCVKFTDCPVGASLVQKQKAALCGFQNGTAKICCPTSTPITPSRFTTVTRPTPSRYTPIKLTPVTTTSSRRPPPGPITVRPSPTPITSPIRPIRKNATAIAIANCERYKEYQFVTDTLDPQIPGDVRETIRRKDCIIIETLIVNGIPALPKEYSHMALIGYGSNFKNVEWACGGSLISEKFVLSAAHCGSSDLGEAKWALLGALTVNYKTESPEQSKPKVYSIVRRFDHPNYKPPSVYNDITLFELSPTVEMSPFVRPACLYTSNTYDVGPRASITGWGLTGAAERRSNQLLKATIKFQEEELCRIEYPAEATSTKLRHGFEPSSMVCAGDLVTGNDTCPGDSGGPLQVPQDPFKSCMWSIVGITSIGPGICGNMESPGIYTKVYHYLDWIQGIVWP